MADFSFFVLKFLPDQLQKGRTSLPPIGQMSTAPEMEKIRIKILLREFVFLHSLPLLPDFIRFVYIIHGSIPIQVRMVE
jgi:hypothetical protein